VETIEYAVWLYVVGKYSRLFIVGKYHKTIALLNKYKCWACGEGLPQGYSMHDCEQEFFIQVECHFDEARF
jgi:hypothetical protein